MYGVVFRETKAFIGISGLIRRAGLEQADLGFAFQEGHTGQGYATEAGRAALDDAHARLGIAEVSAITSDDNAGSIGVLINLGFLRSGYVALPGSEEEHTLFLWKSES
jgi:RimJ/RimL family protein N-acetyltransferase